MLEPRRFGTFYMLATFVRMNQIPVRVYRLEDDDLKLPWEEQKGDGSHGSDGRVISLLHTGVHHDLLVRNMDVPEPPAKRRRARGKQPEAL